jgi:hypothetical protein
VHHAAAVGFDRARAKGQSGGDLGDGEARGGQFSTWRSPDPGYAAKRAAVARARAAARASGGRVVLVYLDEFTYYCRPSVARYYAPAGGPGATMAEARGVSQPPLWAAGDCAPTGSRNGSRLS